MASNLAAIHAAIISALRADTTNFGVVEDHPNDPEKWLEQFASPSASARLPALHVSSRATLEPYYTDAATREEDAWEIKAVFRYSGSNFAQYVTLRDAVMHAIFTDTTFLSSIECFAEAEAEMGPQEEAFQQFTIRFKTYHAFAF